MLHGRPAGFKKRKESRRSCRTEAELPLLAIYSRETARPVSIDVICRKGQSLKQRYTLMASDPAKPPLNASENSTNFRVARGRHERRQFERFAFNADAEVLEPQSGTKITGRVTDLSLSGCYVDTLNPFLASTMVHITIVRGTQMFAAQAKVGYCKLGMGMGLAFVSAQPLHKKLLGSWIVELGGKLPPALATASGDVNRMSSEQLAKLVSELIAILMRKGVLTETEKQEILTRIQSS